MQPGTPGRPLLVLASVAPACGKSTLAPVLAKRLALPLLARDAVSEELAAVFDPVGQRHVLLTATFRVFYRLLADVLRTGAGVVAESNFHRGTAERDLRPFLATANPVIVHCHTAQTVILRRFAARARQGDRRWSAHDAERLAQIHAGHVPEAWTHAEPLDLAVPVLPVDTTDGYAPDLDAIVAFVLGAASDLRRPAERLRPPSPPI